LVLFNSKTYNIIPTRNLEIRNICRDTDHEIAGRRIHIPTHSGSNPPLGLFVDIIYAAVYLSV